MAFELFAARRTPPGEWQRRLEAVMQQIDRLRQRRKMMRRQLQATLDALALEPNHTRLRERLKSLSQEAGSLLHTIRELNKVRRKCEARLAGR